ncbi:putative peptide transporter ptr2 [Colletotrichum spaethianum]|uniref:Peptide transporter ptr2 n=1 Tax=Colletotrichum spaethianum TaxID=700344 RepID=A0AA37L8B9_9PEZI|nr:putative peptide transporter ptr2 [Colletotrichum spaethianum]GKT41290.1 putative peptide transporter ptr2 [Colletotrichum spaethianum]
MSTAPNLDVVEAARANYPAIEKGAHARKTPDAYTGDVADGRGSHDTLGGPNGEVYPTEEELLTLRRIHGKVDWLIYSIGFVEMCERFAYYGTTAVCSTTGAGGTHEQAGALGLGQRASTALTLFNSFWSYVMPLVGGYLADAYWGRYLTIQWAIAIATFGHILIIVAAVPSVISNPSGALAAFIVGLVFFGTGVGWFKANISPLIAEQYELTQPRQTVETLPKTGERVIIDPVMTISRVYMRYYFLINVGALVGQISMVYAEKYVGFWLSYLLPTIMFFFCPVVMLACRKRYAKRPPTGSVLGKSFALVSYGLKQGNGVSEMGKDVFWERIKPSRVAAKPAWMTFDDAWVDEVRRGVMACTVFLWFPVFWLAYGQMTNNLINQAATMRLDGIPNDIITNLNPFALLIFIPICDKAIYPAIERAGLRFTPIKKITLGFLCATLSMVVAAVIQHFIYQQAPCGYNAGDTDCIRENGPPEMTVWIQTPCYILIALSEIFASITGLEYAFTKAPKNMRGLVTGVFWFVHAFSSAIAQAFVGLAADPLLLLGGVGFWLMFRKLDKEEDALNALPESTYKGRGEIEPESKAV